MGAKPDYIILDRLQAAIDYMEELSNNLPPYNLSVTMTVRGQTYTFTDVDQMAAWVAEEMNGN
jgi:hypothetical protein